MFVHLVHPIVSSFGTREAAQPGQVTARPIVTTREGEENNDGDGDGECALRIRLLREVNGVVRT